MFWSRPGGALLRAGAALTGMLAGLCLFVAAAWTLSMTGCIGGVDGETTSSWLCRGGRPVMDVLCAIVLVAGPLAAVAGGIATAIRSEARWWAIGCGFAALCLPLLAAPAESRVTTFVWN